MKKILYLFIFILSFAMSSCGGGNDEPDSPKIEQFSEPDISLVKAELDSRIIELSNELETMTLSSMATHLRNDLTHLQSARTALNKTSKNKKEFNAKLDEAIYHLNIAIDDTNISGRLDIYTAYLTSAQKSRLNYYYGAFLVIKTKLETFRIVD